MGFAATRKPARWWGGYLFQKSYSNMFYDSLFFGFYTLNKRLLPSSEQPAFNAVLLLSILLFCNIISAFAIVEIGTNKDIFVALTPFLIIGLIVLLLAINILVFYFKGRYKKIIVSTNKKGSERAAIVYLILSVSILASFIFYMLWIGSKR